MRRLTPFHVAVLILTSTLSLSCSHPEVDLCKEAESHFKAGEYNQAVAKTTRALEVTDGGKWNTWGSSDLLDGTIWLLRAHSYVAMGRLDEAIADYTAAIERGNQYSSSAALTTSPKPGVEAAWYRRFSRYFNSLGIAYAKAERYEDALASFKTAIAAAGGSVDRVDTIDQLVGVALGGEADKRKEFAKVLGAYCYNIATMEWKLKGASNVMKVAMRLGYDETLIVDVP